MVQKLWKLLQNMGCLNNHFEILHTQSRQWILEDIEEFIEARKGGTK